MFVVDSCECYTDDLHPCCITLSRNYYYTCLVENRDQKKKEKKASISRFINHVSQSVCLSIVHQ